MGLYGGLEVHNTISSILEVLSTQSRLGEVLSRQAAYVLSFLVKSDRIDLGLMQTDGSCLTLLTLALERNTVIIFF